MKQILFVTFLTLFMVHDNECIAQQTWVDSLRNYIDSSHDKLEVTNKCMDLGESLMYKDSTVSEKYLRKGLEIAKGRDDYNNIGRYYLLQSIKHLNYSNAKKTLELTDSAIFFFLKGIEKEKDENKIEEIEFNLSSTYNQKATALNFWGYKEEAIKWYLAALKEYEKTTLPEKNQAMAAVTSNIGGVYISLGNLEKVLEYDKKGLDLMKNAFERLDGISVKRDVATLYLYVSDDYLKLNKLDSANIYLDSSKISVEQLNEPGLWQKFLSRKALLLSKAGKDEEALLFYRKALFYAELAGGKSAQATIRKNIGDKLILMNRLAEGRLFLDAAWKQADSLKEIASKGSYYLSYLNLESKSGNYKKAFEYSELLRKLNDSLNNKEMTGKLTEIEKKYDTEKKEKQIIVLKAEKKQKSFLNKLLIGAFAASSLIVILGYRNYRTKRKLQQQRITELEKEKQLTATEAVLKGEEQERTRLAKDLHDGLGGMLSGIKYNLSTMKGNLIMTPDNALAFERSVDMLDSSIQEMRRVAHNMMPEVLVKFGLNTALEEYCSDINKSGALKINYQSLGLADMTIEQTTSITIYRIIQELINNAIKHANATTALVQINKTDETLSVTVEDNGKGFNTALLSRAKGIGWTNIQHRVDFLKGKLDVQSEVGNGTSVHIEINN